MNDHLWNMYLRAPWYWQLFLPALLALQAIMMLYFDHSGIFWSSHEGWNL